eukprot:s604_g19.t1
MCIRSKVGGVAFVAVLADGSCVSWGAAGFGGDIEIGTVQEQLKDVQQAVTNGPAFAAILGDGSVLTWGESGRSGDSSSLQEQLNNGH